MKLEPSILAIPAKRLVGLSQSMSIANDRTGELFQQFMPRKKEIANKVDAVVWALQVYPTDYFSNFDPNKTFTKWALAEISKPGSIPANMETFDLPGGNYALFHYKGLSSDRRIFQHIFSEWLPNSGYRLDQRPHFERLGEKFRVNDPDSEEEIWIPIQT